MRIAFIIVYIKNFNFQLYFLFATNTMPRLPNRRITEYLTPQYMYFKRLPTFVDLYRHFLFVFVANYAIAKKETFDRLIEIWKQSSLPTYVENSALKKLTRY